LTPISPDTHAETQEICGPQAEFPKEQNREFLSRNREFSRDNRETTSANQGMLCSRFKPRAELVLERTDFSLKKAV